MRSDDVMAEAVTVRQAAKLLAVSVTTIRRLIRSGQLAAFYAGTRLRIRYDAIADFMDRHRAGPKAGG